MTTSLRPLMPPAALISAAAIFEPSEKPLPTKAAGPAHDVDVADLDFGIGDAGVGGERGAR